MSLSYEFTSNLELLSHGTSVEEFLHPGQLLVGVEPSKATELMHEIYEPVIQQKFTCPLHSNNPKLEDPVSCLPTPFLLN